MPDRSSLLAVPAHSLTGQLSLLSESIRTILNTAYLMQVQGDTLYFCHSSKEKMDWLVNDLTSSLIFGHAKLLGCDYVHFHYYGKVSVAGGLTYIRNSIANHSKQLKEKQVTISI